ncbi:MAG TPA: ABC transporter ATP-binding protein [Hyphomicrobiaceae bacterium]|jgi:NitT/TauT family transport system ATP-binding protein|nr:ABC transporter ATP-binding protein [Hyphomicrobiaceae bacterium]
MSAAPVRIAFEHVSVSFPSGRGRVQVVDDVSYVIHDREFVSVIGPSGCGKTTMMNIVAGFMKPSTGTVRLDGKAIAEPGPDRGVIFQEYGVFPWLSVKDNIAFGLNLRANRVSASARDEICHRYMTLMGLVEFAHAWPRTLSGGMRQRLALARAYAVKPQFLLMDEPFGALDAQTRSAMQDLLLEVLAAEGKTVMLITHSVEEAIYLSNRIVVMTARPTRIREIIDVPFPYPRTDALHETPQFGELRAHVRNLVMQEYAQQARQRDI